MNSESCDNVLSEDQLARAIANERKWLNENNGVSAVTGGPVEDQEGVPLPSDMFQGTPATPHDDNLPEVVGDEGGGGISAGGVPGSTSGAMKQSSSPAEI